MLSHVSFVTTPCLLEMSSNLFWYTERYTSMRLSPNRISGAKKKDFVLLICCFNYNLCTILVFDEIRTVLTVFSGRDENDATDRLDARSKCTVHSIFCAMAEAEFTPTESINVTALTLLQWTSSTNVCAWWNKKFYLNPHWHVGNAWYKWVYVICSRIRWHFRLAIKMMSGSFVKSTHLIG